ncbi:MAG: hypothetical protein AB7G52_14075, partial [Arcobacter sp.]
YPIISLLLSTPSLPTMHQQIGRKQQNILSVPPDIKLSDFLSHGYIYIKVQNAPRFLNMA